MHYSMAHLSDNQLGMDVLFSKVGKQFQISIFKGEEHISKKYDTLEEAYVIFEKLSSAIVRGQYSYEDRKGFLQ